jgi:nitrogen fixation NifU-like protein
MDPHAQQIIELYKHPLNFRKDETADIIKIGMNLSCGDQVSMYIRVKNQNVKSKDINQNSKIIESITFEGTGCSVSVASASLLTEMLKGKTLEEVLSWGAKEIEDMLGVEMGPSRLKCALLPLDTIQEGIREFKEKNAKM